jgi:soluble lytic murein transglycosylase-like protein
VVGVPDAGKSTLTGFAIAYNRRATYVAEASSRFGVPAHWIRAVMQVESTRGKGAMLPKGAMGLMHARGRSRKFDRRSTGFVTFIGFDCQ